MTLNKMWMHEVKNEYVVPTLMSIISNRGKKRTMKENSKCWSHFDKLLVAKDGT